VAALGTHVVGAVDGVPVVMHASLGRGAADLLPLATHLAGHGYRTVAVDPRSVSDAAVVTLHDLAADVVDTAAELGLGPFHALGHAFGNRVVRCLAVDAPELVSTVTLLGAGGMVPPDREVRPALNRCFELQAGRSRAERVDDLQAAFFAPRSDASTWLDGWDADVLAVQLAAMRATALEDWWQGGRAPMLVVQGRQDRAAPPENGRRLAADRPLTTLVEIDGAGHALLPERPDEVAAAVCRFLDGHRPPDR
jgi:pimeloyl-ACP methyl ester carboxylesterase